MYKFLITFANKKGETMSAIEMKTFESQLEGLSFSEQIYVMEYLDCNEDEVADDAWTYGYKEYCRSHGLDDSNYDNADEYNDWNCDEDECMYLEYFESEMDSDYLRAFEIFISKWRITDLHNANFSCGSPSQMKIVDYAGWGW